MAANAQLVADTKKKVLIFSTPAQRYPHIFTSGSASARFNSKRTKRKGKEIREHFVLRTVRKRRRINS